MLEFTTWRELVVAFVRVQAERAGWSFKGVRASGSSGSCYVMLRRGSLRAEVRVSDHRPGGIAGRKRVFSVRQAGTSRLAELVVWLQRRATEAA